MTRQEIDTAIEALQGERERLTKPGKPMASTVESVYGKSLAELEPMFGGHIPLMDGGKPVVRPPICGEWFLPKGFFIKPVKVTENWNAPRLILSPRRRLVYPVIGERQPTPGELVGDHLILGEPTLEEY